MQDKTIRVLPNRDAQSILNSYLLLRRALSLTNHQQVSITQHVRLCQLKKQNESQAGLPEYL